MTSHISKDILFSKVLVAVPTYSGKDYMLHNCINAIKQFTYPNFDYIIIDNTQGINYYSRLRRQGYKKVTHIPRGENSRQALVNAQNYARQKAIDEGYDYLLFVESDLLPQKDIIERLLRHNKKVVGSLYLLGTDVKVPCVFVKEFKQEHMAMGTRLLKPEEFKDYYNQGLKQVHGVGLGTTLIEREILEKFPFYHDERFEDKHSDVYFYMHLDNAKVPVFVDTDILTPHYPSQWDLVKDR